MRDELDFLWDILSGIECEDWQHKSYMDFQLSKLLERGGYCLAYVRIESTVQEYQCLHKDIHYLGAEVAVRHPDGTFHTYLVRPRFEGSDDEWRRLMMGVDADDLIIRFSLGRRRLEPLWTSVVFINNKVDLTGERIDWYVLDREEFRIDTYTPPCSFRWGSTPKENYDDMMEALDPDYDSSENPYLDWY